MGITGGRPVKRRLEILNGMSVCANLGNICEALAANGSNNEMFDRYLMDFLALISSEKIDVGKYVRDPSLPQFVQFALRPFLRVSATIDETFQGKVLEIIEFFKRLFGMHPTFLDVAAANFPLDLVLPCVLNVSNVQFVRSLAEFIAELTTAPTIQVKSSGAATSILSVIMKMIDISGLSGPGLVICASLIKSSPIFVAAIKSSADLRRIRAKLTTTLSGDDHLSAVGAIASLIMLFPRSVDVETAKTAATHAISVANDNVLMLKMATLIMIDVARDFGWNQEDFNKILKAALKSSPVKSYVLFETLNTIIANSRNVLDKTFKTEPIIAFLLTQATGFVAYSAVKFLEQIAEQMENAFDGTKDVENLAIKALELAALSPMAADIDLVECAIVVLRFLVSSEPCFEKMKRLLEMNEESIFVSFQRNIESNRVFASLGLFLFIAVCAKQLEGWGKRLRLIVIDTQFGALVAYVVEKSTDRRTISDAIRAISIISTYSMESDVSEKELLFDNVVSGFANVNSQTKKDEFMSNTATAAHIAKKDEEISELYGQIEIHEMELKTSELRVQNAEEAKQAAEEKMLDALNRLKKCEEQIASLESTLKEKSEKLAEITSRNDQLEQKCASQAATIEQLNAQIQQLTAQVKNYEEKDSQRIKTERENVQLEQQVQGISQKCDSMKQQLDKQTTRAADYKAKVKKLKEMLDAQASSVQKSSTEKEKQSIQMQSLQQQIQESNRARDAEREKYQLMKTKLRETHQVIEKMRQQELELRNELAAADQKNKDQEEQIEELLAAQQQFELITQFIHRITDETPIPSEQLMALFNDS